MAELKEQIDNQTLLATPSEHSFAHAPVRVVADLRAARSRPRHRRGARSRRVRSCAADLPPARSSSLVSGSTAAASSRPVSEKPAHIRAFESPGGGSGRLQSGPQEKIFCVREGE